MADLKKVTEGIVNRALKSEKSPEEIIKELQNYNAGELTGKVFLIDVQGAQGRAFGFLFRPDRTTLGAAISQLDRDPLKANEILLRNSWVGGDERILEEDEYFFGAISSLGQLLEFGTSELKKI